jgi:hypothetical protein
MPCSIMYFRDVSQSPIAEPQLLASTHHLSAMTPCCAPEPPASVFTTVGAYPTLQSYATPSSVAQSTHGQRPAAHNPFSIPAQSQHLQANSATFSEPQSTSQPAWYSQQPAALREDPDVAQLRASSLEVFISSTPTMALPVSSGLYN